MSAAMIWILQATRLPLQTNGPTYFTGSRKTTALPLDIRAFGNYCIVFGEADTPSVATCTRPRATTAVEAVVSAATWHGKTFFRLF